MGIKVENDMLVLDNTFSKEDVEAIDEFVKINIDKERERIIKLLEELKEYWSEKVEFEYGTVSAINADEAIALIQNSGESKEEFVIPNRKNNL